MSAAAARRGLWMLALLACVSGCSSTGDDARVLQVLNQRGFGRPTQDANRQYYLGIGDGVVVRSTEFTEYSGQSEVIRMDGTVTLSDVGEIYLNGLTPDEATQVVREHYAHLVKKTDSFIVFVTKINSKRYYVTGVPPYRPKRVNFEGDTLLIDALITAIQNEDLVDTDKILVLRGDPENPLQIACDYDAIRSEGLTRDNIMIRENDIIYLTPSWIGYIAWFVSKITAPLTPIKDLILGANQTVSTINSFGQIGYQQGKKFNQFN
jgi:hypothetical protein